MTNTFYFDYCNGQYLSNLRGKSYAKARVEGWACDVWELRSSSGKTFRVSSGYAPIGKKIKDSKWIKDYDESKLPIEDRLLQQIIFEQAISWSESGNKHYRILGRFMVMLIEAIIEDFNLITVNPLKDIYTNEGWYKVTINGNFDVYTSDLLNACELKDTEKNRDIVISEYANNLEKAWNKIEELRAE